MWFQGTLVLKTITGRNGPFNVAKLHLDVGEFAVKHPLIQQLDEGRYPVTADVENFFIATRPANGASISELAAWVKDLQIQSDDAVASDFSDPLMTAGLVEEPEDLVVPESAPVASEGCDESAVVNRDEESSEAPAQDAEVTKLFGDLADAVMARQPVKLDAASNLIRAQAAYLRTHGFKYKPMNKIWLPVDEQD